MASVLAAELGIAVDTVAVEQTVRGASEPHSIAFSGSYTMHGSTYWTDPATSVRYRVSDPVAGRIGGVTGQIYLGGERICIDPDGRCADDDRASYLEPEGGFTAPTHAYINGSNGVVATFHTFFNKTYFPWFWARHGNRTSINFAALPTTRLMASGVLWTTFDGGIVIDTPMPTSVVNHHEVEVALVTGLPGNAIFDAEAACGFGYVIDPDVNGNRRTGNGPRNWSDCPD